MRSEFLTRLFAFWILSLALSGYSVAQPPAKQTENTIGMKLTLVPEGEFMMGAE